MADSEEEEECEIHLGPSQADDLPVLVSQLPLLHRGERDANFAHYDTSVLKSKQATEHVLLCRRFGLSSDWKRVAYCASCHRAFETALTPVRVAVHGPQNAEVLRAFAGEADFSGICNRDMMLYRKKPMHDAALTMLLIWRFRSSELSVLPRDLAVLLAQRIYDLPLDDCWYPYRIPRVRFELDAMCSSLDRLSVAFNVLVLDPGHTVEYIMANLPKLASSSEPLVLISLHGERADAVLFTKTRKKCWFCICHGRPLGGPDLDEAFLIPARQIVKKRQIEAQNKQKAPSCVIG